MSRGGSRWGAGRPGHKLKEQHALRLDIRALARGGHLKPGNWLSWSWRRNGEEAGSIGVRVRGDDLVTLEYSLRSQDPPADRSQPIRVERTACNFGNTRPWFVCPRCANRAAVLYFRWGRFACRSCQKIAYKSQSGDTIARLWIKIEARLGEGWARPKGMRRQTHERLIQTICEIEGRREDAVGLFIEKTLGRVNSVLDKIKTRVKF
jgi:hypothetical protein